MQELLQGGTTLLFVSHELSKVEELCEYGVWIDKGKILASGRATEVVKLYTGKA